jgi:pimeloyl-ACP methyl ester carboxylesterase
MTIFGLLHGGSHGAWCWERLTPELERRGFKAVAVDMPMDQMDCDAARCAEIAAELLSGFDDLILVGHSIAGTFLPLTAAKVPTRAMVFLCAMVPVAGLSLADQQARDPSMVAYPYHLVRDDQGRTLATREIAKAMYFTDCSDEDIDWAMPRLRPQSPAVRASVFPANVWPKIPSHYILGSKDAVVSTDWSRKVARERLGVEAVAVDSAHSPFLSRPVELADALARIGAQAKLTTISG